MQSSEKPRPHACVARTLTRPLACVVALGTVWLADPSARAQSASVSPAPDGQDDIVALSPFVVEAETESGYQATETLAGMRLRTNLRDVGAAINVLTDQFLDDVGAVDMNDALRYVPNMQYADFPGAQDVSNLSQWFSSSYISRGVVGDTVQTDFFNNGSVPIDRYNTESLTFMRGPNAILFGIGSPSGVVGSSSKRANLSRNLREIRFLADTWGTARSEIDVSHVLKENVLAVRLAGVMQDKKSSQDPSLNRRNAIYGTLTWRPFDRTSITVLGESGVYERLHVQNNLVNDAYTPWVIAGRPTVRSRNGYTAALYPDFPQTGAAYSTAVGSGLQNTSTGPYLVYIEGSNLPVMDWRGMARGSQWGNMMPSGNPGSGLPNATDRTTMNNIPFDYSNAIIDLYANIFNGLNRNDLDYNRQAIFVEQNLARNLDLELAYNRWEQEYLFDIFSTNTTIWVDPNELLPNGAPNPYVGLPFIDSGNGGNSMRKVREWREYEDYRATLSYLLDLDDRKIFRDVGFGNYRIAALYQDNSFAQKLVASRFVNVFSQPGVSATNPLNNNSNRISHRYYLQPGESMFQTDGRLTFDQASIPGAPTNAQGPLRVEERSSDEAPRNNYQTTESVVGAIQGSWWFTAEGWPRLMGMYGMRRDTQSQRGQSFARNAQGEYPHPLNTFDGLESYGTWGATTKFTARTKAYNVTVRPISELRLFYNYSDIFRSPAAANFVDVFGNPIRPAFGETKDYGIKLDLFGERVFLTATKFETGVVDTSLDNSGTLREPINHIYDAIGRPDLTLERPRTYRDDTTEGYEYELTARPIKGLDLRATYGTQETTVSAAFDDWVPYFDQNRAFWQQHAATPLLSPGAGYMTVADAIARADQRLIDQRAIVGQRPTDQRTRNASFNASYRFQEGWAKNVKIGGGFRWASSNYLGYARGSDGNLDVSRPFIGGENFATDASIGYSRSFRDGKLDWSVQVICFNIFDDDDIRQRQAVDSGLGTPVVVRRFVVDPRAFQLSTSLKF